MSLVMDATAQSPANRVNCGCISVPEGPQEQTLGLKRNHEQSVAAREGVTSISVRAGLSSSALRRGARPATHLGAVRE